MFNFKKVASVLASTLMIGSTAALAAAANYPAPFVQNGAANVAIVWGSAVPQGSTDLVAVADITASLQAELAKQTATTGGSTGGSSISGGDFVKLEKSTDKLNVGDYINNTFGITVDDDDLEVLLVDGTYLNDENTEYDYEQSLSILGPQLTYFADSDYKSKEPTVGFQISSGTGILNYTLDFQTDAESDIVSSDLADLETTTVKILGRPYYILDAINGTSANYLGKVTLLDSANSAIVTEGETQTVTVGATSYEVSINFVDSAETILDINGERTNSLNEGETFKLSDGTYVGIKDILYSSKDTGISKVEFSVGKGKLEVTSGSDVELNDDAVDGVKGWFVRGSLSSGKQTLDKIVIQWLADDEVFIAPGSDLTMPGFNVVKFSMGDFVRTAEEKVIVDYDGDDSIEISVPVKDGTANFNILQANSDGNFTLIGKDTDERLATGNGSNMISYFEKLASNNYHRYFVATYNTSDSAESYLLSARIDEKDNKNRTTIKNEVTGSDVCTDKEAGKTCDIGDVSFTISTVIKQSDQEATNLTAGTNVHFDTIATKGGLMINLPVEKEGTGAGAINFTGGSTTPVGHSTDLFVLFMTEEDKDDNIAAGKTINVTANDNTDNDVHITLVDSGYANLDILGSDDDTTSRVRSALGTEVRKIVSNDKGKAEIVYAGSESYAEVFLTDTSASVVGSGPVTELGSVSVMDSEVASKAAGKNLIVVGGSCINTVAAGLIGAPAVTCGADFTAKTGVGSGQFLIETYARSGGTVATLVAGYNAQDTLNAATYLRAQTVDTTMGKKYIGTSSTSAQLVTSSA